VDGGGGKRGRFTRRLLGYGRRRFPDCGKSEESWLKERLALSKYRNWGKSRIKKRKRGLGNLFLTKNP